MTAHLMVLTSMLGTAYAQPPSLSAAVQTSAGAADAIGSGAVGHDVRMGILVTDRLLIEGISASSSQQFEVRAGARWFISEPWSTQGALSLTASGGLETSMRSPMLTVGGSYDFPLRQRLLGRVGLELGGYTGTGFSGARISIGLTLPPREADVVIQTVYIERPVEPEPVAEEEPVEVVWMPEPVCDWMPADEASQLLSQIEHLRSGTPVSPELEPQSSTEPVEATAEPVEATAEAEASTESVDGVAVGAALASAAIDGEIPFWSPEEDLEGSLIVLAHPGDRVLIGGEEAEVDETGVAHLTRAEGPVTIEVYSGGQQQRLRAALVPKHAVWVRAGDPDPTAVFFKLNSSALSSATKADIQTVATYAASWSFVLQGGYSQEGSLERNRQLAIERARAVSRAMQEAGIDADRIVYLDPPPPDPNQPPEEQRNCQIIPVAPGGA